MARRAAAAGVTPDALTALSLLIAVLGGISFYLSSPAALPFLALAGILVAVNAFLDAADGALARLTKRQTPRGDYFDHVADRYADLAFLVGITFSPWLAGESWIGLFAVIGTLLTSYMGTQAQAVGVGRDYAGIFGRADRLGLLVALPILQAVLTISGTPTVAGRNLLVWGLLAIAILGNVTALQRFARAWSELS